MAQSSRQAFYIALIIVLVFVIIIFLISIPLTKKRYSSNPRSSTVSKKTSLKLSEIIENNKIVRFRAIGNGQTYKLNNRGISSLESYDDTAQNEILSRLQSMPGDFTLIFPTATFSPTFAQGLREDFQYDRLIEGLDNVLIKKYQVSTKPDDLTEERYQEFLEDGWYLMPAPFLIYPDDLNILGNLFTLIPFVYGNDKLLGSLPVTKIVENNQPPTRDEYRELIFNTPEETQKIIDSSFEYRNIFRFVREIGNVFSLELIITPNVSYEITRHVLLRPEVALSEDNVENGVFSNPDVRVTTPVNLRSNPLPTSSTVDLIRKGFYIEE